MLFQENSKRGKMDLVTGLQAFAKYHIPDRSLRKIWELVDFDNLAHIDEDQCAVAVFLIKQCKSTKKVPKKLPNHLIPPRYRS